MVSTMAPTGGTARTDAAAGLEALFRSEYRKLVGLARLLVDDSAQAEEVVQDAFVALHPSWSRATDPLAYLRSSVVNGGRGLLRRRATARRHLRVAEPATTPGADDRLGHSDDVRAVAAALARLPERQRACIALRFYAGLSEAEIATTLGISTGSVKTHVHRAMATLSDLLEARR
jgi:RNA polymerase sigma-70 factor (sigma-E family)